MATINKTILNREERYSRFSLSKSRKRVPKN